MFVELQPLLTDRSFVLIVSALMDGQIQCQFIPKSTKNDTAQDKPVLQPLTLTATAAELDAGMPEAITSYGEAFKTLTEQVAATKKAMADAKAAEEAERKSKNGKKTSPAKPAKAAEPKPEPKKADAAPSLFDAPATEPAPTAATADAEGEEPTTDDSQDEAETENEEEEVFEP